jgi:hypothetical protein
LAKPPLTVRNAEITTASVEIKTLTVSGKQVTLAVFRQLREVPLVLDDGTLAGQPWGIVNYHPDKCAGAQEHWHIVWQQGAELRRSAVPAKIDFQVFWPSEGDRFISSCVHDLVTEGSTPYLVAAGGRYGLGLTTSHDGFSARVALSLKGRAVATAKLDLERAEKDLAEHPDSPEEASKSWNRSSAVRYAATRLEESLPAFTEEVTAFEASTDELYRQFTAIVDAEKARRDRHVAIRESLAALPQLFIAV